jgi:hypothetical protein
MPKKIRLMDDATATADTVGATTGAKTHEEAISAEVNMEITTKALMKYLEAIDWKLWEMLKIMKKQEEEK